MAGKYEISGFRILNVECSVDPERSELVVRGENKLVCRRPIDQNNKSGMLEIETTIGAEETEKFKIRLLSQAIFSFSEEPEDLEEVLKKECYPVAKEKINAAIKTITAAMGLNPLEME